MADLPPFPRELLNTVFNGDIRMINGFEELLRRLNLAADAADASAVLQAIIASADFVLTAPNVALGAGQVLTEGRGIDIAEGAGLVTISHPIEVQGGNANFILTGDTNLILPLTGTLATTADITGGSVVSVSVVTANGVSGSVTDPTTTPAITLTLGDITPSSVVSSGNVESATTIRSTGVDDPLSGAGVELNYFTGIGHIYSYDRDASSYQVLSIYGSSVELYAEGSLIANVTTDGLDITGALVCDDFRIDQPPVSEVVICTHTITINANGTSYKVPMVAA